MGKVMSDGFLGAVFLCGVIAASFPVNASIFLRMQTDLGSLDIELYDTVVNNTVQNFLNYVNDGAYDNTFIHRSVPGFVVQGGGYIFNPDNGEFFNGGATGITVGAAIPNEFNLSNTRATLAMYKEDGDPDGATSQWFVNLADNSTDLDTTNGGYTVFGQVLGDGMDVFDEIAGLLRCVDVAPIPALCGKFPEVPAVNTDVALTDDTLVNVIRIGPDNEGDGAIDSMEDAAPNGGDGNGDTVLDSTQQHVASFQAESGDYLYIETLPSNPLSSLDILGITFAIANPATTSVLTDLVFNQGYFGFDITGTGIGGAATAVVSLPQGFVAANYVNYGPTQDNPIPHWYEFLYDGNTGAELNGNQVILHYVDGERGDSDNEADGVVTASRGGPATLVGDGDGVSDEIEDAAPNNGDGNGDGTLDSIQAYVASLRDIRGLYITVESAVSTVLRSLRITAGTNILATADPASQLNGLNFAHGFLSFEVLNIGAGGSVDVRIILPEGEAPVTYYNFGPTPENPVNHLYEFLYDGRTGADISANVITLHFRDGERGDADLIANGTIVDPGAPALGAEIAEAASGGGGGCTVASGARPPSQAGAWWLLLVLLCLHVIRSGCGRISR